MRFLINTQAQVIRPAQAKEMKVHYEVVVGRSGIFKLYLTKKGQEPKLVFQARANETKVKELGNLLVDGLKAIRVRNAEVVATTLGTVVKFARKATLAGRTTRPRQEEWKLVGAQA